MVLSDYVTGPLFARLVPRVAGEPFGDGVILMVS